MSESPNDQLKRLLKEASSSKGKKSRLGVAKHTVDGVKYDSKSEIRYRAKLELRIRAGEVERFEFHVRFPLIADGGIVVGHYESDFVVWFVDGHREVHDVKHPELLTDIFLWKFRHFKAQYGEEIILIHSETLMAFKK